MITPLLTSRSVTVSSDALSGIFTDTTVSSVRLIASRSFIPVTTYAETIAPTSKIDTSHMMRKIRLLRLLRFFSSRFWARSRFFCDFLDSRAICSFTSCPLKEFITCFSSPAGGAPIASSEIFR